MDEPLRLIEDARLLGVPLGEQQALQLLQLLDELSRWNRTYNLTSITAREAMISGHLLDSLAAAPFVRGERVADVGTGAGFPGLPLAVAQPARAFTLIDSVAKKVRFVTHAVRTLGLSNVTPLQTRVETLLPQQPFDTVLARAYATLADLLGSVQALCGPDTRVIALKGLYPHDELAEIPRGWRLEQAQRVQIPRLGAERHLLCFVPQPG